MVVNYMDVIAITLCLILIVFSMCLLKHVGRKIKTDPPLSGIQLRAKFQIVSEKKMYRTFTSPIFEPELVTVQFTKEGPIWFVRENGENLCSVGGQVFGETKYEAAMKAAVKSVRDNDMDSYKIAFFDLASRLYKEWRVSLIPPEFK